MGSDVARCRALLYNDLSYNYQAADQPGSPDFSPACRAGSGLGGTFVVIWFDSKESSASSSPTLVSFLAAPASEAVSGTEMLVKHFVLF